MSVLDGLSKQLNGRNVQGKLILEGVVWFADLHKGLAALADDVAKFSAGPAGTEEVQKFLGKLHESCGKMWKHLGEDTIALQLLTDVQSKRSPDDLGVEGAPSYMTGQDGAKAAAALQGLNAKVLECGVQAQAWEESGIPARLGEILTSAATVRGILEGLAGTNRAGHGELDDRMFEVYYAATGQIGNRHFQDQGGKPGLLSSLAKLLKALKRELMLVKAPAR